MPASAQPPEPQSDEDLSILAFPRSRRDRHLDEWIRQRWVDLLSGSADREQASSSSRPWCRRASRVVVKERDRFSPLAGVLPGDGFRLVTEVFPRNRPRGRIATWTLDIRKPRGDTEDRQPWRVIAQDRLSSVEGLHRLAPTPRSSSPHATS
ncbi:MAG: hypothetical protein R2712_19685 [Vicinamibacterales bacterium]